jgi:hypothetical protein
MNDRFLADGIGTKVSTYGAEYGFSFTDACRVRLNLASDQGRRPRLAR